MPRAGVAIFSVELEMGKPVVTCCLVTPTANEPVAEVHDRMPVIVPPESYCEWLDPETPASRLVALQKPYTAEAMPVTAASTAVNSPTNDGPECLKVA